MHRISLVSPLSTSSLTSRQYPCRAFPLQQLAAVIDPETRLSLPPTPTRSSTFSLATGQPFALPLRASTSDPVFVVCPCCDENTWTECRWLREDGTGYAQRGFAGKCRGCGAEFTREVSGTVLG